ncbi:MAG TPA: apolipoprotein N-acyltransferase [Spirochaetota bacterium]|nr:apolipoprotein N-acyltransferase [Spirochaetota bacterium]HOM38908.1 apolipoprotein N-acyltransferase [Spirochaetota bacterium]HPQ49113.1 apolipoprotein N-acyltransferase [Spirochaetota bacterium]
MLIKKTNNKLFENIVAYISKNKIILSILGGILFTLTVYPFNIFPLVVISLFSLFRIIETSVNYKESILYGWLYGIIIYFIGFIWLIDTIKIFGGLNIIISIFIFLLFCIAFGLKYGILTYFISFSQKKLKLSFLSSLILSSTIVELLYPELFPFHIGDTQASNLYFIQISDVIGIKGISILILVLSWLLYLIIFYKDYRRTFSFLVILFSIYSYGFIRIAQINGYKKTTNTIKVGLIQPDTEFIEKLTSEKAENIVSKITYLLKEIIEKNNDIGIIVLPESATPFSITNGSFYGKKILDFFDKHKDKIFVFNEIDYKDNKIFNTQTFYSSGNIIGKYHKIYLLPFGEYIPFSDIFKDLNNMFPQVGNFSKGDEIKNFKINDIVISPNICYEAIIPNFVRNFIKKGGQLIINITNDRWFGISSATFRHLDLLKIRAIENRVPIIRATNSGTSAIIDQIGNITNGPTPIFKETYLIGEIKIIDDIFGLYTYTGDFIIIAIGIFIILYSFQKRKRINNF